MHSQGLCSSIVVIIPSPSVIIIIDFFSVPAMCDPEPFWPSACLALASGACEMAKPSTFSLVRAQGKGSDPRWLPQVTCANRYPGFEGIKIQSAIFSDYLMIPEDVRVHYYAEDGITEPLSHHPLSARNMQVNRERLIDNIMKEGIFGGGAGQAWCIPAGPCIPGKRQAYLLLSHGTRAEAVYQCMKQEPINSRIVQTVEHGILAKILDPRTPPDVLKHLKELRNAFHKSRAGTNHIELYAMICDIESAWNFTQTTAQHSGPQHANDGGAIVLQGVAFLCMADFCGFRNPTRNSHDV